MIGGLCAIIGRILLASAAFGVSVWWGLGVFLPFGPLLFRLSYPELAPLSKTFRLIALPCILVYFAFRPGPPDYNNLFRINSILPQKDVPSAPANHYSMEKVSQKTPAPSLQNRRAANAKELRRLTEWSEGLRLKKRDLLRSDAQGNIAYNAEVVEYNSALAKATAEKNTLWGTK